AALRAARTVYPKRAVDIVPATDPVAAVATGDARLGVASADAFFSVEDGQPVLATSAEALGVLDYEVAHLVAAADGPASFAEVTRLGVGEAGAGADRMARMLLAGTG